MGIKTETIQHKDYLEIKAAGTFDMGDAMKEFQYVLDVCRFSNKEKVLVDYRKLGGYSTGTAKGFYALAIEDMYKRYLLSGGAHLKMAYVTSVITENEPHAEMLGKSELHFSLFDNAKDALEWLGVKGK
jgi:hypothetical protein